MPSRKKSKGQARQAKKHQKGNDVGGYSGEGGSGGLIEEPTIEDKRSFAKGLSTLTQEELGKVITDLEAKCPKALTKNSAEDEVEINVNNISPMAFREVADYVNNMSKEVASIMLGHMVDSRHMDRNANSSKFIPPMTLTVDNSIMDNETGETIAQYNERQEAEMMEHLQSSSEAFESAEIKRQDAWTALQVAKKLDNLATGSVANEIGYGDHAILSTCCTSQSGKICNHGLSLGATAVWGTRVSEQNEPFRAFMKTFYKRRNDLICHTVSTGIIEQLAFSRPWVQAMAEAMGKHHASIWKDDDNQQSIKDELLSCGADMMFKEDSLNCAAGVAGAILFLENTTLMTRMFATLLFEEEAKLAESDEHYLKLRNVLDGCERSVLRFYCKRLSCSCLDERYRAVAFLPKTGICDNCQERKERKKLMVCSICRGQHYCSRSCQVAHWPIHVQACQKVSHLL